MIEYEEMLDKLYKELPKKTKTAERFEMPDFTCFTQGKQTIIKNLSEVANKLRRDPNHIIKFLSKELAVPGTFDGTRGILHGNFRDDLMQSRLKKYIDEFVLCNECKKPDTELIVFEGVKHKRCEVCGARAPVKAI